MNQVARALLFHPLMARVWSDHVGLSLCVTLGSLLTFGYLRATVGHLWTTVGDLRVTIFKKILYCKQTFWQTQVSFTSK